MLPLNKFLEKLSIVEYSNDLTSINKIAYPIQHSWRSSYLRGVNNESNLCTFLAANFPCFLDRFPCNVAHGLARSQSVFA